MQRRANYRRHDVIRQDRADGSIILRSRAELGPVARRTTDWLDEWAARTPDAVFLAERSGPGWRTASYGDVRDRARALAAGLLDVAPGGPIMILSGNSVDHGVLALAAQYVGIPIVPIAEQYALIPDARGQIDAIASVVRPGMVYAEDGGVLSDVLDRDVFAGIPHLVGRNPGEGHITLNQLERASGDIAEAEAGVTPDTVAKILMTSGSTSSPKGVETTHLMMCANQAQIAHAFPFLADRPPVLVDWLPWNHVFGGSHNFNLVLSNGGALYIDGGKPVPHLFGLTLENLRLGTGTIAFNVPAGFGMMRDALRADADLRQAYFEDLDMLFYAGASLPQDLWTDLADMARDVRGDLPLFTSSWGLTETAPAALSQHQPTEQTGVIGIPLPGEEVKLIPDEDMRCEVRVRGPNVFGRYLNDPDRTAEAFDAEGFFRTGDAMVFIDPEDPNLGLRFDGRISEDFKLQTGTWVRAANLRLDILAALGPLVTDAVLTGEGRNQIGCLLVPSQSLREGANVAADNGAFLAPDAAADIVAALSGIGGSSSSRVARALILEEPPSMADGEITAKGNLNFRKLLLRRAGLVARLYDDADPATIHIRTDA